MTSKLLLTVIIPCYNEKNNIEKILKKITENNFSQQIILVDDFSTDGTRDIINSKLLTKLDKVIFHKQNLGKGAAIKSAMDFISGEIVIIQDADLEYDPKEYNILIKPIIQNQTNVVYGSRVLNKKNYSGNLTIPQHLRVIGNKILTFISNIFNNQKLTDAHTCYKVFKKETFMKLNIQTKDFAFCPEVTTKLSKLNENIIEVPITYKGRSYEEGKKIKFRDFFIAIFTIIKFKFFKK